MQISFRKSLEKQIKTVDTEKIYIFNRWTKVTPNFLEKQVFIYNGIRFFEILVNEKMLGHTFGEFAPTRKFPIHKKKKKTLNGT